MKTLSKRTMALPVSAALTVDLKVKALQAAGRDVVSFCVGEPDFDTPETIRAAGEQAIAEGRTRYTNAPGMPELRAAIAASLKARGIDREGTEVAVTTGAKYAVYAAVSVLCDPGDEVILPAPYWTSYYHIITLAGAVPRVVLSTPENGWKLTPAQLRAAVSEKTKAIILNNPANPSGAVYDRAELTALSEIIREADIFVIADEIYDRIVFTDAPFTPAASLDPDMHRRTVTINGVSKTYAMTGWRIGYAAAEADIIGRISALLSHTTGCPNTPAQLAAITAITGPQAAAEAMSAEFKHRRDLLTEGLRGIPGLTYTVPDGTFYLMPQLTGDALARFGSGDAFAVALLEQTGTAVVPCSDYGVPEAFRMSFTLPEDRLLEGVRRIRTFLSE